MFLRLLVLQLLVPACLFAGPINLCVRYVPDDVQCPMDWNSDHGVKDWHRPTPAAFSQGRAEVPHLKLGCAAPPEFARAEIRTHPEEHLYFSTGKFKRCLCLCLGNRRVEYSDFTH